MIHCKVTLLWNLKFKKWVKYRKLNICLDLSISDFLCSKESNSIFSTILSGHTHMEVCEMTYAISDATEILKP